MTETINLRDWAMTIYRTHGQLTPELVRDAARPEDSPAHAFVFNVPIDQAAEAFYLERAHTLIRSVKVTIVARPEEAPRRVRFFHAVPGEESAYVYEPLDVIRSQPDKLAAARTEAMRRLHDAQTSVEDYDAIAAGSLNAERTARAIKAVKRARQLVEAT